MTLILIYLYACDSKFSDALGGRLRVMQNEELCCFTFLEYRRWTCFQNREWLKWISYWFERFGSYQRPTGASYADLTHCGPDNLADNIFKCIFLNENDRISIQIPLIVLPRVQVTQH